MAKKTMTLEELSQWFSERVQKATGAKDAKVTVQYKLVQPDSNGKSWSDSLVVNPGSGSMQDTLQAVGDAYREAVATLDLA